MNGRTLSHNPRKQGKSHHTAIIPASALPHRRVIDFMSSLKVPVSHGNARSYQRSHVLTLTHEYMRPSAAET